jgi:tetratricopeptide (TPR) repeat protein
MEPAEQALRDACGLPDAGAIPHFRLGSHLFFQGRWVEAESAFRDALSIERDAITANYVGRCLHEQQKLSEAEYFYRLAIELPDAIFDDDSTYYKNLGHLFFKQQRFEEAVEAFEKAAVEGVDEDSLYWKAQSLLKLGRINDAEVELLRALSGLGVSNDEDLSGVISDETASAIYNLLGNIRAEHQNRLLDALAMYGESLRREPDDDVVWSNRAIAETRLGWKGAAEHSLKKAIFCHPGNESYRTRLETLYVESSEHYGSFGEFIEAGKPYLDAALWTNAAQSRLLLDLFRKNHYWWSPEVGLHLYDYVVNADFLDESLARAESLSEHLHLQIEFPVQLSTPEFDVFLDQEGNMLRAFISSHWSGVAVSINLETWDLHYVAGDADSMFAAGVALNFFLDCGINLARHPKFTLANPSYAGETRISTGNCWSTTDDFDQSVRDIRTNAVPAPPKAHRVKGFIRTLSYGNPSEDALSHAPSYVRRNMKPGQTFVRPHQRGGGQARERLYRRLQTHSSLADYLATAPRSTQDH